MVDPFFMTRLGVVRSASQGDLPGDVGANDLGLEDEVQRCQSDNPQNTDVELKCTTH